MHITMDEWLAELKAASSGPEDVIAAKSTLEVAEILGLSGSGANRVIRREVMNGRLRLVGRRKEMTIDGRMVPIPVYGPVSDGQKAD